MPKTVSKATIEDLYRYKGKAELVDGRLKIMEPAGFAHGEAGFNIVSSLRGYTKRTGVGLAVPDNVGIRVYLPNRLSFSPDAAYHLGPPTGMKFLEGAPAFAAEVRSGNDYGAAAEREMRDKRADYFAAGTLVVWDVDLLGPDTVRVFRDGDPDSPAAVYRRGDVAEAEPAVPSWRLPVNDLFS